MEPVKKFLNIQRVIMTGGRDMDGFSQLAAGSPERMETRSSREDSECFN